MKFSPAVARILTAGVLMAFTGAAATQEAYPNKPIRIIVPSLPGGPTDLYARMVAQGLTKNLKQQVLIVNHPGASGIIGTDIVAKAPPDAEGPC